MNRIAAFVLFLFVTGLSAQSSGDEIFRHPLEAKNMNVFRMICSGLAGYPFIKGNFEQEKFINRQDRHLKSSGNFIIAAGLGMVWDTERPFPSTLVLGKDYLIQSRPGGQKTVLGARGNDTFIRLAEVINTVFLGNAQGLLDNFDVYFTGSSAAWELGLSPRNKTIGSFAEKIIMKGDAAIKFIQIFEQGGDTIKYILNNHSYPAELTIHERTLFSLP
ncbi:MAG: outer membrane lipoprotein carrier protein LolA [Treponema sp.]|jgi:hypothetical protein|nr:outer membrane lipoprotein carrier protein LolA [Treponema sp.]